MLTTSSNLWEGSLFPVPQMPQVPQRKNAPHALRVSGRYRGTARFGLGDESEVDLRLSHLVKVSLRLDLARLR